MTLSESSESVVGGLLSESNVPVDMVVVALLTVVTAVIYYAVPETPLRFLAAVPLLFVFPGYVVIGILFPRRGNRTQSQPATSGSLATARDLGRVTAPERVALSVGLSIALVPFFGFLLEILPVTAFDGAILPTLVGFVLIGALIASARRLRVPADERFRLPLETIQERAAAPFTGPMPRAERVATIALAATILLAVLSVGYVFAVPPDGEEFTDFRVMTESPSGELTLGNYPDRINVGDTAEFVIGIDNYEGEQQAYTVVVVGEQIIEDDGSVTPIETSEVGRFETTLEDGERIQQPQTITPGSPGEFRISYYLYEGDAPADPDAESAYRHVHFTVTAVDGGTTTAPDDEFDVGGSVDT